MPSLLDEFADLPDPHVDWTKLHLLIDIVIIAICAVICSAETYEAERVNRFEAPDKM